MLNQKKTIPGAYAYANWDGAIMPKDTGASADALDLARMGWGQYHEAGHLRQQGPWTWDEMGEVTVNLYSIAAKKVLKPTEPARPFFDKWGLSATDETRNKIKSLNLPLLTAPIWFGSDYNIIKPTDGMDKVKGIIGVITNSQETSSANNAAVNAFDGDTNTIWHSEWNKQNQFPYHITAKYASPANSPN